MHGSAQRALALSAGVALALIPSVVGAVRAPDYMAKRPPLETASGDAVRYHRDVRWDAPADGDATRALQHFTDLHGRGWQVIYDKETNVPLRIYGEGIPVPGSINDARIAEDAARAILSEQIELLAPGSKPSDFTIRIDDVQPDWKMRSIAFSQTRDGVPVLGGEVTFTFKHDRLFVLGSTAIPHITEAVVPRTVSDARAIKSASAWVLADVARAAQLRSIEGPFVLPLVRPDGVIHTRSVVRVTLDATPVGQWAVYVDAGSGEAVAREQMLRFATATVNFDVPDRWPQHGRHNLPARGAQIATGMTVAADGKITFTGATTSVTIKCVAPFVKVLNASGAVLTAAVSIMDGQTLNFGRPTVEKEDAQLAAFIASGLVKKRMKEMRPQLGWLDQSYNSTVNLTDSACNAYSNQTDIFFYAKGASNGLSCENTGRIQDVTMHETGHSFHAHNLTTGQTDGSLGEGISDYFAIDITEDPKMGRGFFSNNLDEPIRDADTTPEATWPDNSPDIHIVGIIIAGALWDARKNYKASLGAAGVDLLDKAFADALARAVDIPSMYPELLASDDDDGNINNGTPHKCLIDDAFARHNIAGGGAQTGPQVANPILNGMHLKLPVSGGSSACPGQAVTSAKVEWKVRSNAAMNGNLNLTQTANGWEGDLPAPADSIVLNYKVKVTFADNSTATFPDNAADPFYETYIGQVDTIYCMNFESDPLAAGWTHSLVSGMAGPGADDWQWGTPTGASGSGDPNVAANGSKAIGNDLGISENGQNFNGQYQADKVNQLLSPSIDLMGHTTNVRLQYHRWLNVEDGSKDKGSIVVDGNERWVNTSTGNEHTDHEWRFHDVDLSADAADGHVQVAFKLASDTTGNRGGWTVDDFCIVAAHASTTTPVCGDGHVDAGEQCDDGNVNNGDGCSSTCQNETPPAGCGNGTVDAGEDCDDGNTTNGDGCSAVCTSEIAECGNHLVEMGEQCDDGNNNNGDGCSATCQSEGGGGPMCGNAIPETGEQCDDGNTVDTDACKNNCTTGTPDTGNPDGGCGCDVGGRSDATGGAAMLLLIAAGALWLARRRAARAKL